MSSVDEPSSPAPADLPDGNEHIACRVDEGFAAWMQQCGGSLAVTTYQAGKVVLLGWNGKQVSVLPRHFSRPMGMAVRGSQMALATSEELVLLADAPLLAHDYLSPGTYDAVFFPRVAYYTGRLNLHDLAFAGETLWAINTRFCCLATMSWQHNFVPQWKPQFISELAPEDRCHLNGMAIRDDRPRYVTALGTTDTPRGWVERKASGGVLIDIDTHEMLRVGLSMPHSPRFRDGKIWLLNSGMGELCVVDPEQRDYTAITSLPGYLRGLCFVGDYAVIGMSQIREKHTFGGLPIQQKHKELLCGLSIVQLSTGKCVGQLVFTEGCHELYDVQFLPGLRRPSILNRRKPAAHQAYSTPEFAYWIASQSAESAETQKAGSGSPSPE